MVKIKNKPRASSKTSFPIIGIGASAGGLEAFQGLLKGLSAKPGLAIVFIMHLSPQHKSMLTEVLARSAKMPITEAKNNMRIEINHIYVIPPATYMSIAGEKLVLRNIKEAVLRNMPIDCFFSSLAQTLKNKAIGVVLSGTATDGTLGSESIKAEGGITFAQDVKSAKYDGMPQSAISAGCIDFVFPPGKIASELERIVKHPYVLNAKLVKPDEKIITEDQGFGAIFEILRSATGLDFSYYKLPTINRRISRRMVLLKMKDLSGYSKFLHKNQGEVIKLYDDLLINVTGFFRDSKVFAALKKKILPGILKNKVKGQPVRIWVPGCSSGEEAYSIAICLLELLADKAGAVPLYIFASDVSDTAVNKARRGVYNKRIKHNITPGRLSRFFSKDGDTYKISKQVREICIFSKQDILKHPPISRLDLISCRNLFIYLQADAQKIILQKFHYALKSGGFLLLGSSETPQGSAALFKPVSKKYNIFTKKSSFLAPQLEFSPTYYWPKEAGVKEKPAVKPIELSDMENIVDRIVLGEYAPCGALINSEMNVVSFRGHTGNYLESVIGKPSFNIFKLAREGLRAELYAAVYKARKTKQPVKRMAVELKHNGRKRLVNITVIPIKPNTLENAFFLVLFDEINQKLFSQGTLRGGRGRTLKVKSADKNKYIEELEKELMVVKEYQRSIMEEHGLVNEELESANEEMMSANEELQSTNEELETSKEELQSSNEELLTLNEELQNRNSEVALLNNDMINLLSSINMPVVMIGPDLVIRRITSQAQNVLNIIPSDIGRPITKVKLNIDIPGLEKIALKVIASLHPRTLEIKSKEGKYYTVYIRPYRTMENKIDGAVVLFVDITKRKFAENAVQESRDYAESIIFTMSEPLLVLDNSLKVITANQAFCAAFKVTAEETRNRFIYDLGNRQWDIPALRRLFNDVLSRKNKIDKFEIEHNFEAIGHRIMLVSIKWLKRKTNKMGMILLTIDDITNRRKAENELARVKKQEYETEKLRALSVYTRSLIEASLDPLVTISAEGKITDVNEAIVKATGMLREKIIGTDFSDYFTEPEKAREGYRQAFAKGSISDYPLTIRSKDGELIDVLYNITVYKDDRANICGVFAMARDITKLKQTEQMARETQERLMQSEKLAILGKLAGSVSHELRNPLGVIRNSVYFLKMKLGPALEDEKIKRHLDILEEEIGISDRIINDILTFARIKEVRLIETDINKIIEDLLKIIKTPEKIKKTLQLNSGLPLILADGLQLQQVFSNIVLNAVQAMPDGGELAIASRRNNEVIEVDIIDTGEGIPRENLDKVFSPLFSTKAQGTGLGLTVCQSILKIHGGSIEVESERGKGAKFIVKLPINEARQRLEP